MRRRAVLIANMGLAGGLMGVFLAGCASPGPPRPPSLYIPRPVNDLQATRSGDAVELRFSVPSLSTDGQPLRAATLKGALCRVETHGGACRPVDASQTAQALPVPGHGPTAPVLWTDTLPPSLTQGSPRPIAYRIKLESARGGDAGFSDPVYAAAGAAPPPVAHLRAEGTRLGVALQWTPAQGVGEVLLRREETRSPVDSSANPEGGQTPAAGDSKQNFTAKPARGQGNFPFAPHKTSAGAGGRADPGGRADKANAAPGLVWLQASPGMPAAAATLDNSLQAGVTYRYTAVRRETVHLGGRTLELQSAPSPEITITWRDVYPPPAPTDLTALGYDVPATATAPAGYAVDLIWLPVEDSQVAGYLVFRQKTGASVEIGGSPEKQRLTPQPLLTPGFHDDNVRRGQAYRYFVQAVGANGQVSPEAETAIQP